MQLAFDAIGKFLYLTKILGENVLAVSVKIL